MATARTRSSPMCCWTSQTRTLSHPARGRTLFLLVGGLLRALDVQRVVDLGQVVGEHRLDDDAGDLLDLPDVAAGAAALLGSLFGRSH